MHDEEADVVHMHWSEPIDVVEAGVARIGQFSVD
jgi:hypothetical protein